MAKPPRRIIYVDASVKDDKSKISLYDTVNNLTHVMELGDNVQNSSLAERYAVTYAIMYAHREGILNGHILCDNQGATVNEAIRNTADKYRVGLSWVPREVNIVADRLTKLEPTVKDSEQRLLNMFFELVNNQRT